MCLAVPGRIERISGDDPLRRTAVVDFGGLKKEISMACVPDAAPGQYVLVHAGVAISTINEAEAARVFDYLQELGDIEPGSALMQQQADSENEIH